MSKIQNFIKELPGSFKITGLIVLLFLILGINFPQKFAAMTKQVNIFLFNYFGDFYLSFAFLTLIAFILIGISPLGKIKIGGKDAKPEFSYFSWIAMLFCTGMGVSIMLYGVAEPLYHFANPPIAGVEGVYEQQITALKVSFLHYGFTPWAIYGLTALAVSFLGFNLKRGILFSSLIGGKKKNASNNNAIDVLTIIAIFFGIVVSFGLGVLLIEGGLHSLFGITPGFKLELLIIALATFFYMASALQGLDKGIKILSNISIFMTFIIFGIIFFCMPKAQLGGYAVDSIYSYVKDFIPMNFGTMDYTSPDFLREWTVRNWSWWIAWAPFVGIFIAITSFGRTIREVTFSILLVPSTYSIIWFTVFGTAAFQTQSALGFPVSLENISIMLFTVVDYISKFPAMSWLTLFTAAIFFINSADSATYTLASFTKQKNTLSEKPSKALQLCWGLLFSIMTALFLFTGGMQIMQEITLIFALPFALLLLVTFFVFIRDLIKHYREEFEEEIFEGKVRPVAEVG